MPLAAAEKVPPRGRRPASASRARRRRRPPPPPPPLAGVPPPLPLLRREPVVHQHRVDDALPLRQEIRRRDGRSPPAELSLPCSAAPRPPSVAVGAPPPPSPLAPPPLSPPARALLTASNDHSTVCVPQLAAIHPSLRRVGRRDPRELPL